MSPLADWHGAMYQADSFQTSISFQPYWPEFYPPVQVRIQLTEQGKLFAVWAYFIFWNTKRCSCIINRKFDSLDLVTQKPVALQLNCLFIMSSLSINPAFRNRSITL